MDDRLLRARTRAAKGIMARRNAVKEDNARWHGGYAYDNKADNRTAKAVDKNKEERGYAPMSVNDMRDEGALRDPDVVGRWRKPNESRSNFPKRGY